MNAPFAHLLPPREATLADRIEEARQARLAFEEVREGDMTAEWCERSTALTKANFRVCAILIADYDIDCDQLQELARAVS